MIGLSALNQIFQNLFATLLVKKIYHDVVLTVQNGAKLPVYRRGKDWIRIGMDDRKSLYVYIRQLAEATNTRSELIGSTEKMYYVRIPYRFVFFNAHEERNFDELTTAIINIAFGQYVDLIRVTTDIYQLQQAEGTINEFELTAKAFYMALDINITMKLSHDNCGLEIQCENLPNPLCKN